MERAYKIKVEGPDVEIKMKGGGLSIESRISPPCLPPPPPPPPCNPIPKEKLGMNVDDTSLEYSYADANSYADYADQAFDIDVPVGMDQMVDIV